jgi:hypothetical protein
LSLFNFNQYKAVFSVADPRQIMRPRTATKIAATAREKYRDFADSGTTQLIERQCGSVQ